MKKYKKVNAMVGLVGLPTAIINVEKLSPEYIKKRLFQKTYH